MQGTSWPMVMSMRASRSMPSGSISRRALAASSIWSSAIRASVPSTDSPVRVVTSKRAGAADGGPGRWGMVLLAGRVNEARARGLLRGGGWLRLGCGGRELDLVDVDAQREL